MNNKDIRSRAEARPGVTGELIKKVSAIDYKTLPANAVEYAKHCFLDWLGVTLAGSREPLVALLRAQAESDVAVPGRSALIGGGSAAPSWAALINGSASHALDFDDVVSAMGGHPSVPVVPAALVEAQNRHASGADFLTALIAGVEMECRVGTLSAPQHYAVGFHPTGTVGTFGAAAACCHLAGLDSEGWARAFGLAAAQAAGLKCMFGTMTKPFHAGKAASNGLLAAQLAARGFTAHSAALEAEQGFLETQAGGANTDGLAELGTELGITRVLFKYHAACYLTHATIEAVQDIQNRHRLDAAQVREIRVTVPPGHLRVCHIREPRTGLEGKFSLRFTTALAFSLRSTGEEAFTDAAVAEASLVSLRDRVVIEPVTDLPNNYSSHVVVELDNGQRFEGQGDVSRPASADELAEQWNKLCRKFTELAEPVLGQRRCRRLIELVGALQSASSLDEIIILTNPDIEDMP